MTYILCAFESEARALIDAYKLQKRETHPFKLFYNEQMLIIISGMGQDRAQEAVEYLLLNFPNKKEDNFLNLGVCAAQKKFAIGTLVQIRQLQDESESHLLPLSNTEIEGGSCFSSYLPLDRPSSTDIAEMEAMGVYRAVHEYFTLKQISFLKIVSDNFNTAKPSKQFIIELTQKNLPQIKEHIQILQKDSAC